MNEPKNTSRRDFLKGKPTKSIRLINEGEKCTEHTETPGASLESIAQNPSSQYLQHFSKRAMACNFEVFLNLDQYPASAEATLESFQQIDEIEQVLSVYRSDSEVSQLNQTENLINPISPILRDVLGTAEQIFRDTQGAFDITSTPLSKVWGFFNRQGAVPEEEDLKIALARVDAGKILLNDEGVQFLASDIEFNLNSIGKGYALDQAAEVIMSFGVLDFVIHGGQSSVIARGGEALELNSPTDVETGWKVGLSHPFIPSNRIAEISLRNQSLSTSGTARQGFFHRGRRYGHVIDPRSGWPTDHFLSATVVCNSAATSDALATAFFVMSLAEIQAYCDAHPEVSAILIVPSGRGQAVSVELFNVPEDMVKLI